MIHKITYFLFDMLNVEERIIKEKDIEIEVIPLWKWLINGIE